MKKNILSLAALLIASATFVACSSDDNIINEQPTKAQTYTMTINASKGDGATTRALTLTGKTLNATWATTENIYVKKGETWATGSLQPDANAATATLKGELSGITIAKDDVLTLQFPKRGDISYVGQVGTLEDIAANFDYATATVTVASVSATGNIIPTEATTTFANQQAIVKFTLIDKADGLTPLSATQLVVNDGSTDYTVNPAPATSEIYVAIPGFSGKTVTLTATVGEDTYTYEKTGVSFTNGQYYEISVKMTKQATTPTISLTSPAVGQVIGSDGKNYAADATLPDGVTKVAMIAYVDGTGTSLAIALADEGSMNWATAISTCEAKTPAFTGGTWKLPTQAEWKQMFSANGGSETSYSGLNTAIGNAGGTALQEYVAYWSFTENGSDNAYGMFLEDGNAYFGSDSKVVGNRVRACLAFTVESSAGVTAYTLAESTLGMVVGTDGKAYAMADKDNLPTGVTAAGVVAYKDGTSGLVIALTDEASTMDWSTACGANGAAAHTPAVEGQSWKLPSQEDWQHIGSVYNGTDLNTAIENAGGTAILTPQFNPDTQTMTNIYWLSTENPGNTAQALFGYIINGYIGAGDADHGPKTEAILVRAVLAF